MRRSFIILIGFAVLGSGIWMIVSEHSRTAACAAAGNLVSGATNSCQSVAWIYFAGFVAVGVGMVVLVFGSLMKRHEARFRRQERPASDYALQLLRNDVPGSPKP